jgi:protein gp37
MSIISDVEWCDSTVSPSSGCDGCELWTGEIRICYAGIFQENRLAHSMPHLYAADFSEVRMLPGRMAQAARWSDLRGVARPDKPWLDGLPRIIFVGFLGDFGSAAITDEFLKQELFDECSSVAGRNHIWLFLTKQIKRLADLSERWGGLPPNVMAMTSVTNQQTAKLRLPHLLRTKARWRGVSLEPLFEHVDVRPWLSGLDWLIAGGVSGQTVKPLERAWLDSLIRQNQSAQKALFIKQLGNGFSDPTNGIAGRKLVIPDEAVGLLSQRLNHPKGADVNEWPAPLRIRQMPRFEV